MIRNPKLELAMDALVQACPSFSDQHSRYLADEYEEDDLRLPYVEVGNLVRHVMDLHGRRDTAAVQHVFEAIEDLHRHDDHGVREFATIGFLEALQNIAPHPEEFVQFLGQDSKIWWGKLNQFWEGDVHALRS